MKKKTIWGVSVAVLLLTAVFFTVTIRAAYYGKGMLKDVFINGQNYFSSDVLSSVSSSDGAEYGAVASGGAEKTIRFFNYSLSTGEYNMFDITFAVYVWHSATGTGSCFAEYAGNSFEITATACGTEPVFRGKLAGGAASVLSMTVRFDAAEADTLTGFPEIFVLAVPELPKYLSSRTLGARIVPSSSASFWVSGEFEYTEGTEISDYAAFSYLITVQGEPPAGEKLRVMWDSSKLTVATHSLPAGVTPAALEGYAPYDTCIVLPETADSFLRLVFLRVQDLPAGETNVWESGTTEDGTPIDREVLAGFVSVDRITDGE